MITTSLAAEIANKRLSSGRYPTPALLVLGAGFEDRAKSLLQFLTARSLPILAINYLPHLRENEVMEGLIERYEHTHENAMVVRVECDPGQPRRFSEAMRAGIELCEPLREGEVWVDISGMPMHIICMVLALCRSRWARRDVRVLYTEASEYFPTRKEYEKLNQSAGSRDTNNHLRLPQSMTSEMQENIIPEMFAGFAVKEAPTCLIVQAGYEWHRSLGVVDHVNPNRLVVVYGRPARPSLQWRVLLARRLHSSLIGPRPVAEEEVLTLDVGQTVNLLSQYYDMLFDNHNISIAPIGGKLQTVGAYLVWEKYRDIQIVYPLPVTYLPKRFSRGVGQTFWLHLPARAGSHPFQDRIGGQ